MNRIKKLCLFILLFSCSTPQKATAQISVNFQVFYDELSPYGEWVDNPNYGYVWVPDVSNGFAPYGTNGYWVFTDAGWTWMSYYNWGWAPFHYGRWYYDPYYGYAWIPGDEWGPGWVIWRRGQGFYGWAPIGPGISIDIAYSSFYNQPFNQWRFVRDRDFGRTNIYNYYTNVSNYTTIINNSTVINNMYDERSQNVRYNTGPERMEVQQRTGNTFKPISLTNSDRPGQNIRRNELQIYKPRVERNGNENRKPAPEKITDWNNGKPEVKRDAGIRKQNENQPGNKRTVLPKRTDEPIKQEPTQPQRNNPKEREQPVKVPVQQPQQKEQPERQPNQQPVQPPRRIEQPEKQKPTQPQPETQPNQRPIQPPRRVEPIKQKPVEQPIPSQPKKQPAAEQPKPQPAPPAKKEQRGKQKAGLI